MTFNTLKTEQGVTDMSLEEKRYELVEEISRLEKILDEMNNKVAKHESLKLEFGTLEKDIEELGKQKQSLVNEISALVVDKNSAKKIKDEIDALNNEKTKVSEEISKMQSVIRVLQQETLSFRAGKEEVLKQMQGKIDDLNYQIFKIEESKKASLDSLQKVMDAHK